MRPAVDVPEGTVLEPIEDDRDCYGVPCSSFVLRLFLLSPVSSDLYPEGVKFS
jgi:hypothetical protein